MTDRAQLHHLADRARRGVLLPAEGGLLADAVAELEKRLEDWKQAAGAGMTLTDNLRAERDALAAGVPLVCSDERHKTKVFALEMRADQAEAAIERVRNLHRETCLVASGPLSNTFSCGMCDALDQPQQPTVAETTPFGDRHGPTPEEVFAGVRDQQPTTIRDCRCGKWPDCDTCRATSTVA